MQKVIPVLVYMGSVATTSSALSFALNRPNCCGEVNAVKLSTTIKLGYNISGTVTSATASGAAMAVANDFLLDGEDGDCANIPPYDGEEFVTDSGSADLMSGGLSVGATTTGDHIWDAAADGTVAYGKLSGYTQSYALWGMGCSWGYGHEACARGGFNGRGLSWALPSGAGSWTFSGAFSFTPYVNLIMTFEDLSNGNDCECGAAPCTPTMKGVNFFSIKSVRGGTTTYTQGVYAVDDGGTTTRRGFFTGSAFNPSTNPSGFTVSSGDVNLSAVPGTGTTVVFSTTHDSFPEFDGNMNPTVDSIVCWTDREIIRAAIGSSINSANYTARADFDLDGDIDANDLAVFNGFGCTADVDCDGDVDYFDYISYINKYNANDPAADMDGDGDWDFFDFTAFTNTTNVGCP